MPSPTAEGLCVYAEEFARLLAQQTGERFDFTPESLAALDAVLRQWLDLEEAYRSQEPVGLVLYAAPAATYIGEVLVRSLDGSWVTEPTPEELAAPHVLLGSGERINVLKKAHDALCGAEEPSFFDYFWELAGAGARRSGSR